MNEKMVCYSPEWLFSLSEEEIELIKNFREQKKEEQERKEKKNEALKQIKESIKIFLENGGNIFIADSYGIWQEASIKFPNDDIYVDIMM